MNMFPLPQSVAALYPAESCIDVIQSVSGRFQAVGDVLNGSFHLVIKIFESRVCVCEKTLMYASQHQKRLVDEHMVNFVSEHEMLKGGGMR